MNTDSELRREMRAGFIRARESAGLRVHAMARETGIPHQNIYNMEKEDYTLPNLATLPVILSAYSAVINRGDSKGPVLAEDALVENYRRCPPGVRRLLSLIADVFRERPRRPAGPFPQG